MASDETLASRLREVERCFRGIVPATIATCSPEGVPNITSLSVVHRVGDCHLALSFQFFNKTRQNILAHPAAQILVPDPKTLQQYRLDVRYERTEEEGPIFERLKTNLDAVASQTGMTGVFRLKGADIYRVLDVELLAHDLDLADTEAPTDFVAALEALSNRLAGCDDLEALLDATLSGLAELLDYRHSMILFADGAGERLYAVASHGFDESGVGAEVAVGDGLIGIAAREKRPVRVANLNLDRIMAGAVRTRAQEQGIELEREIALPGLQSTQSQIAVPLVTRGRTLGVLSVQSDQHGRLTLADEQALSTLARYLSTSIVLLGHGVSGDEAPVRVYARRDTEARAMVIRYHAADDSIFIDDEYLIKGLAGRILLRLLSVYERDGRIDFTNKELRVDDSLQLDKYRDNLEARLILLRRRLEERTSAIRLTKTGRGRFRLELAAPCEIVRAR